MILVDTSVWVDHLRRGDERLKAYLEGQEVLTHPCVIGELALGHLLHRAEILGLLGALPESVVASQDEVLVTIERNQLHGTGIGYVDAQLLAATLLTPGARLWTRDRRLSTQAVRLGLNA
jgi:predicted nucleic acid-binding protein